MKLAKLRERAAAGDAEAQATLGARYGLGKGVRRNRRLALYWNRLAAQAGEPLAQYNLAQAYYDGYGTKKDVAKAMALYEEVWRNTRADPDLRAGAALNLGWESANRRGSDQEARRWYVKGRRFGEPSAFYNLGLLELESDAFDRAEHNFRLGAALQHRGCIYELARLHVDGYLDAPNMQLATKLLRSIARNHARARRLLASSHLARLRKRTPTRQPQNDETPDGRFAGEWDPLDSEVLLRIDVGAQTTVECWGAEEDLLVSNVRWHGGDLWFDSFCQSTRWDLRNRLLRIEQNTLLLTRTGSTREPTIARRVC